MMNVEIKFDEAKLNKVQLMIREFPRQMPRVMKTAINRTASTTRKEIVKALAAKSKLKQKAVRKEIRWQKATLHRWSSTLNIRDRKIPLINFRAKQSKKGVAYSLPDGGRKLIEHAFIQTMTSGHRGVYLRVQKTRLPIVEQMGPSLANLFKGARGIVAQIKQKTRANLGRNIDKQIDYILTKRGRVRAA